jgi:hypothetical protein
LGIQSRAVARSHGIPEGDCIAAILPLTLTPERSGFLQVRKFDRVSFSFPIAFWRIHFRESDSTVIYFILFFFLRRRLFFSRVVWGVWGLPGSEV